ncbi:hypothetical protein [Marinactinospora rubrisoli]|uniref:RusA-like resolvase n=1 Tax=Marinactinospora rubrisoli TaxID=2715399 RepID=A0ABW2KL89_9ACTN
MTAPPETRTAVIKLPVLPLLNSNQRLHWAVRARRTKVIRETAALVTWSKRLAPMSKVAITAVIHPKTSRRFDPHNLQPTVKAAIDGLVDAGLVADDDSSRVVSVAFIAGAKDPAGAWVELVVREVP